MRSPLYLLESQLALRVIMNPMIAGEVATQWLSPLPQQLIELIAMAPRLCALVGVVDFVRGCHDFDRHPQREIPPVLQYAELLAQTSLATVAALPPVDEIMTRLERIIERNEYERAA